MVSGAAAATAAVTPCTDYNNEDNSGFDETLSQEQHVIESLSSKTVKVDLVLQVNRSHLQRVVDYVPTLQISTEDGANVTLIPQVVGVIDSTPRRKLSLVLVSLTKTNGDDKAKADADKMPPYDITSFVESGLGTDQYIHKALNKVYIVSSGNYNQESFIHGSESEVYGTICQEVLNWNRFLDDVVTLKVEGFPLKTTKTLLGKLEKKIAQQEGEKKSMIRLASSQHTHVLNIVRIDNPPRIENIQKNQRDDGLLSLQTGYYLWGLSPKFDAMIGDGHHHGKICLDDEDGDISRAYYKLEEAFSRYAHPTKLKEFFSDTERIVALDCGAAPGGWTKYLQDETPCETVYNIDPGKLNPNVAEMKSVYHMPMKLEEAIPILLNEKLQTNIWVSDMCLHNVGDQVEFLLQAKNSGLLSDNALFVITLKCVAGYSDIAYNFQAKREIERLRTSIGGNNVSDVTITHLFSNRSGERTIMGLVHSKKDES